MSDLVIISAIIPPATVHMCPYSDALLHQVVLVPFQLGLEAKRVDLVLSIRVGYPSLVPLSLGLIRCGKANTLPDITVPLDISAILRLGNGSLERIDT